MPSIFHLNVLDLLPQRCPALLLFINRKQDAHNAGQAFSVVISQHCSELQDAGRIEAGFHLRDLICGGDCVWRRLRFLLGAAHAAYNHQSNECREINLSRFHVTPPNLAAREASSNRLTETLFGLQSYAAARSGGCGAGLREIVVGFRPLAAWYALKPATPGLSPATLLGFSFALLALQLESVSSVAVVHMLRTSRRLLRPELGL